MCPTSPQPHCRCARTRSQDLSGQTALAAAASAGAVGCVRVLLAAGAARWLRDRFDADALDRAAAAGHGEVVRMLEEGCCS